MAAPLEDATHEEQRAVIRFLAAEGEKPNEVYTRMSVQYGSSCLNQRNVYIWIEIFKEGRISIKDEPRQGRPSEGNTPEKKQAVNDMILAKRRIAVEEIAQQLDTPTGTAHHIIREVLKCSKVSTRWVPKTSRLRTSKTALTFPGNSLISLTKKRPSCCEFSLAMKHVPSTMSLRRNSRAWNGSTHLLQ